jgi:4-azaleucine resistance transporter AzlC
VESPDQKPGLLAAARRGFAAAWPIMAGYVVLGLPCGILSAAAGVSWWMCAVFSIVFYSGAGQYMIPNMWLAANPVSAIVASVCLVNTRQVLYGTSLARFCAGAGKRLSVLFAATVTDESYGVNYAKFHNGGWDVQSALAVNLWSQATWTLATTAGALLGAAVSVPTALASFAMTALFICLLCMQDLTRGNLVAMAGAAAGVVACKLAGLSGVAVLVGAVVGVACAVLLGGPDPRAKAGETPCR